MAMIAETTRPYQLELTELAIASNIIIVLDTGSGKTHIAARVLTHYENLELQRRDDFVGTAKLSFFLVPTVTLVEQQSEYVSRFLRKIPMPICGAMDNMDRWNRGTWNQIMENHTVVVCTGEILNQALARRYVTINDINMIIFDEAHHTKAGHPYAIVMKRYKEGSTDLAKPRILGMTASPAESTDNIEKRIRQLENLMEAQIVTASDASLPEYVHRPVEEEWEYVGVSLQRYTDLGLKLTAYVQIDALRKIRESAARALSELGPWCADKIWHYALDDSQLPKIQRRIEEPDGVTIRSTAKVDEELRCLKMAANIIQRHRLRSGIGNVNEDVSHKVRVLHSHLEEQFSNNPLSTCIVFVKERTMARALFDVFKQLFHVKHMVPTYLVGMHTGEPGDAMNSWVQQKATMKSFRNRIVNCIFATQVAEEGVDIPACNLVVRFNPYSDIIQYVQSRGRARRKDSVYAVMTDTNNSYEQEKCQHIRDCELWLQKYYTNLAPERLVDLRDATVRGQLATKYGDQWFGTTTGARCDLDNSLMILEHYANSLQYENIAANRLRWIETPEKKFILTALVPIDTSRAVFPGKPFSSPDEFGAYLSNLPSDGGAKVISIQGLEMYHKGFAKRSAALNACRVLRSMGVLDENLDTVHKKKLEAMDHIAAPALEKQLQFAVKIRADLWNADIGSQPTRLCATVLSVQAQVSGSSFAPLVLFTRQPLHHVPPFPLVLEDEIEILVEVMQIDGFMPVTSHHLELLTTYTLDGVFSDVYNKRYERNIPNMQYWLAPAVAGQHQGSTIDDIVDISQLQAIRDGPKKWDPHAPDGRSWAHKFLVSTGPLGRWTYLTGDIAPEVTIEASVPKSAHGVPNKNIGSIFKFTASASSSWKGYRDEIDPDQPVFEACMVSFRRDFRVAASKDDKARSSYSCQVCPQPLQISPLQPDTVRTLLLFPSILCHLNDCLLADEVADQVGLEIPTMIAVEAITYVTEDDTNLRENDMEVQKYPNKNYERLEFYGDTFLKLAIVLVLFVKLGKETALNYHVKKKELISNHNLSNVVRILGLDKYMRSGQVERREIWPAHLKQFSGKKARKEAEDGTVMRSLHQKSIADVAEALIGATLVVNFNTPTRFDEPLRAVTKLVQSSLHQVCSWSEYTTMYVPPDWQTDDAILSSTIEMATTISETMGYTFQHPNLCRSAITHKSYTSRTSNVPNYERLEILGDGLYDMCVADFLFHKYPNRGPQFLTEHKDVMVSNKFMSYLCVKLKLHRFVLYASSAATVARCNSYVDQYVNAIENDKHVDNPNFWYELDAGPKMFADIIEALVGAMFIDSNFDFGVVERFFNTHVRPYFEDETLHSEVAHAHPVTVLIHFLKSRFHCMGFHAKTETLDSTELVDDNEATPAETATAKALSSLNLAPQPKLNFDDSTSDTSSTTSSSSSTPPTTQATPSPPARSASESHDPHAQTRLRATHTVLITLKIHASTLATCTAASGKIGKSRAAREGMKILKEIAGVGFGKGNKEFEERFGCGCRWSGDHKSPEIEGAVAGDTGEKDSGEGGGKINNGDGEKEEGQEVGGWGSWRADEQVEGEGLWEDDLGVRERG